MFVRPRARLCVCVVGSELWLPVAVCLFVCRLAPLVCVCGCLLLCVSTFACDDLNGLLHDSTTTATTIFMKLSNAFDVIALLVYLFVVEILSLLTITVLTVNMNRFNAH